MVLTCQKRLCNIGVIYITSNTWITNYKLESKQLQIEESHDLHLTVFLKRRLPYTTSYN